MSILDRIGRIKWVGGGVLTEQEIANMYANIAEATPDISQKGNIGALGSIPFYASSYAVQTIQNAVWSGKANYASHKRIGSTTLVEATGSDADEFSFDMLLSADLGVNPWAALEKIITAERQQTYQMLTIGDHAYGRYRWLIADHKIKLSKFDANGNLWECLVSVKLVGYLRE